MVQKSAEDCLSCKIISIGCLFGIGIYMFSLAPKTKAKITYNTIGAAAMALGVGQIFDWSPFRNK